LFEFLLDTSNLQSDYTLYIGILFGLTIQFFWVWNVHYRFYHSIYSSSDVLLKTNCPLLQMKPQIHCHIRILWIIKYIRRKVDPSDEQDDSISSTLVLN
jgi:hypothetical protein